jgi:Cytochrome C biogenesis protein
MQRDVEGRIICMCGSAGCVRSPLNNCPMRPACHGFDAQTAQLQQYIKEGKSQEDILASFVKEYGSAVLAIPTGGFNALSWMLPYGLAALGLLALVVTARRWSSRPAVAGAGADATVDPAIDARLDDELRDLD